MTMSLSKRTMVFALCAALVVGFLAPAEAAGKKTKKKKKKLVQVDQEMFLRGDGCDAEARGLSLEDADDTECTFVRAGILYDAIPADAPEPVGADPYLPWPAFDGVPFTLDATKPITGEIYTAGFFPLVGDFPTFSIGSVRLEVQVVGETEGEEVTVGEFVDEFTVTPSVDGEPHMSEVEIEPDSALNEKEFTSLTLITRIGGVSVLHGRYVLQGEASSFITVPTWARP